MTSEEILPGAGRRRGMRRRASAARLAIPALALLVSLGTGPPQPRTLQALATASATSDPGELAPPVRGPDGRPLPFRSMAEVETFLREARILGREVLESGSTRPLRLVLERDGLRARGIFRHVDEQHRGIRLGRQGYRRHLRDFHGFEVAAYRLDRALDLGMVPPAVVRSVGGRRGSVQLWIEAAMTEADRLERGLRPPTVLPWMHQRHAMRVFDYLIANDDRHANNILVTVDSWRLWLIDHTRAFQRHWRGTETSLGKVVQIEGTLWNRLRRLDPERLRADLASHLPDHETDALLERRHRLVEHFERLIEERGRGAVVCPASADAAAAVR